MSETKRFAAVLIALAGWLACGALLPAQETPPPEIKVFQPEKKSELTEFTFFYSNWSLDLLRKPVESIVGNLLEDNLTDALLDDIIDDFPLATVQSYTQDVSFDSGGSSFGFEARWYPGGRESGFSLGFALAKTSMRVGFPLVTAKMEVTSPAKPGTVGYLQATVENVNLRIEPVSFHMVFDWEMAKRWRVHPYFSVGLGLFSIRAFEEGRFTVAYNAQMNIPNIKVDSWQDSIDKSVRAFIDEDAEGSETKLPSLLPIIQLHFGIVGRITDFLSVRLKAGFFNGFVLGAGLTWRV